MGESRARWERGERDLLCILIHVNPLETMYLEQTTSKFDFMYLEAPKFGMNI